MTPAAQLTVDRSLTVTTLTWPTPTGGLTDRWVHQLLHALADQLHGVARAHHTVTDLRATLDDPDDPDCPAGDLPAILHRAAGLVATGHDTPHHIDQLVGHDLHAAAAHLRAALTRRCAAIAALRELADLARHPHPDRLRLSVHLDPVAGDLRAAGDALIAADHHIITAHTNPRR